MIADGPSVQWTTETLQIKSDSWTTIAAITEFRN